jgi:hypothetical protein
MNDNRQKKTADIMHIPKPTFFQSAALARSLLEWSYQHQSRGSFSALPAYRWQTENGHPAVSKKEKGVVCSSSVGREAF